MISEARQALGQNISICVGNQACVLPLGIEVGFPQGAPKMSQERDCFFEKSYLPLACHADFAYCGGV